MHAPKRASVGFGNVPELWLHRHGPEFGARRRGSGGRRLRLGMEVASRCGYPRRKPEAFSEGLNISSNFELDASFSEVLLAVMLRFFVEAQTVSTPWA